jgi:hypothetical protein
MTQPLETPPPPSTEADDYFLGYGRGEQRRLQRQAEELADEAAWLLDRLEPLDGGDVVEIGCGPRGYLDALSERVGPAGTVVGLETNEEPKAPLTDRGDDARAGSPSTLPGADTRRDSPRLATLNGRRSRK